MPAFVRALCFCLIAILAMGVAEARTPAVATVTTRSRDEIVHVVQVGQYLSLIAKRYHTTADAIRKTNGLAPGATLKPGTVLRIAETPEHAAWRDRNELRVKRDDFPRRGRDEPKDHGKDRDHPHGKDRDHLHGKDGDKVHGRGHDKSHEDDKGTKGREAGSRKGSEPRGRVGPNADKWTKKPVRPGYVVLSRFGDSFRGQLRASNGNVIAKAAEKVDWLLRSGKTNEQTKIDRRLVKLLTQVSDHFGGRPIELVSGYRPFSTRQFTKNSRHNHGEAVDYRILGVPNLAVYEYCLTLPQTGCGYYPNSSFIHMDVRLLKTRWVDYSGPGQAPVYARPKRVDPHRGERPAAPREDDDDDDPEPEDD
jgi:uncharacterized protein YcbK (DUF882 family)